MLASNNNFNKNYRYKVLNNNISNKKVKCKTMFNFKKDKK